ncbi:MAG: alkylhydroperoxidase [Bradymonadales bacterium]|nr:MAG: alkylhydroperoxidase [Bradymonadales bacterium]
MNTDQLFEKFDRQTLTDMKLNFKKFFESESYSRKESALTALACAEAVRCPELIAFAEKAAKESEASDEEISEARDAAIVMGVANNYYRFRHFVKKDDYQKPAGFRMSVMAKPVMGKKAFEMAALAVSVINGCEVCVEGHEKSVIEHGGSVETVHDVARLASCINGLAIAFEQIRRR